MSEVLYCWIEGELIGRFTQNEPGQISFAYDIPGPRVVSLSLPRTGASTQAAAMNFLNALLPENPAARDALKRYSGARSASTWDLLEAAGQDVAGGLVLLPREEMPTPEGTIPELAREDNIAQRVMEVRKVPSAAFISDVAPIRYSLAGAQGKFSLSSINGSWHWPSAAYPSTHIFKPSAEIHPGLDELEAETLRLARLAGIDAPHAEVSDFLGQHTFAIERFDRRIDGDGLARRLHAEDLTQALAEPVSRKYYVSVPQIVRRLREHTGDDELGYAFLRQLAFNVTIGNADAHGKNYTLMLGADGEATMSPLYDAIPLGLVPGGYSMDLAMKIGHARHFNAVTPDIWRSAARKSGLDPDRAAGIVREVAAGVAEHLDETIAATESGRRSPDGVDDIRRSAERNAAG